MQESLHIKNFAGMCEVHLDVGKITLLIGPQATGKSVCAKLLYFFKSFPTEIWGSVEFGPVRLKLDEHYISWFRRFFPPDAIGSDSFLVKYTVGEKFIQVGRSESGGPIQLNYSKYFSERLEECKQLYDDYYSERPDEKFGPLPYSLERHLQKIFGTRINGGIASRQIFVAAGRSFLANLRESASSQLGEVISVDPMMQEFGKFFGSARLQYSRNVDIIKNKESEYGIRPLVDRILKGEYRTVDGKDYLVTQDGRRVDIGFASSGQQEAFPMILTLRVLMELELPNEAATAYIEEPEAHVFPDTQRDIVNLIAALFNARPAELQFFITTHSPYILTSLNVLLQAGILRASLEESKLNQLYESVPAHLILEPGSIRAYSLEDGKALDLMDPETGLMSADVIDDVSEELAIDFEKLLEVE